MWCSHASASASLQHSPNPSGICRMFTNYICRAPPFLLRRLFGAMASAALLAVHSLFFSIASASLRQINKAYQRAGWHGLGLLSLHYSASASHLPLCTAPPGGPPLMEDSYCIVSSCACRRLSLPFIVADLKFTH